mgnify:CR=1 FL=1
MAAEAEACGSAAPILRATGLRKVYAQRRPLSLRSHTVCALDGVDLTVTRGAFLAVVGESGSGKSTVARCVACLERPSSGSICFEDRDVLALGDYELRRIRPKIQLIFQDAATALNPTFTAAELVEEPLRIQRSASPRECRHRAMEAIAQVGLPEDCGTRLPHQFSGGQRQRLAIARALVQQPALLILDEACAGLDLSLQAQIMNLLLDLRDRHGLTYLYISHDLTLVRRVADEVAVMERGRIVERGAAADLFRDPQQPVTRALIAAVPQLSWRSAVGSG